MFLILSCSCLCPIHWSQVLSWEWRCSCSSTIRRCSYYIWVINNFITYYVRLILEVWGICFSIILIHPYRHRYWIYTYIYNVASVNSMAVGMRSWHYNDVIMSVMVSQITSLMIVYSTFYSGEDQRKHQSSTSLAFVWRIHRWPLNSRHKWPVTRKMFPFDDVIMLKHFCCKVQSCND